MKLEITSSARTGPFPCVRPKGPTSSISRSRMMDVSACEPHRLVLQSRGVPSATERPGMTTPLAPSMEVTRPWEEAAVARAAMRAVRYSMVGGGI